METDRFMVVERFVSVQGEGHWAGTPMAFIRLAQCPVGGQKGICKNWNGREFICDTGPSYKPKGSSVWNPYTQVREVLDAQHIHDWVMERQMKRLCVTGGEPLIYPVELLISDDYVLHVETSGTVMREGFVNRYDPRKWITLSPKFNYLPDFLDWADEIKILVDEDSDDANAVSWANLAEQNNVYLSFQPIENENQENLRKAMRFAIMTNSRLSLQTHKYMDVR